MKKLLILILFSLIIFNHSVFAQEQNINNTQEQNINNILNLLLNILQKLFSGSSENLNKTLNENIKTNPNYSEFLLTPPTPTPSTNQFREARPVTPEDLKPILPDEDREDDYIVQINNLKITHIVNNIPNSKAIFIAVADVTFKCSEYENQESDTSKQCKLNIRKPLITQKELAIKITNDTVLLLKNRQRAKLENFKVGDKINVYGFMDKDNYGIEALIVRKINTIPSPSMPPAQSRIKVISPNGGEIWSIDSYQTIIWSAPNDKTVNIYLKSYLPCLYEGEVKCAMPEKRFTIAENLENTGSYTWQVGRFPTTQTKPQLSFESLEPGYYLIEIFGNQSKQSDVSDKKFEIIYAVHPILILPSISGYLEKKEASIDMWGTHQLKGDDGHLYQLKASNLEVYNLLNKYVGERVKIHGKKEYQTIEGGFWSINVEKVELEKPDSKEN